MKRIAIFASGSGSNAEKIIEYFGTDSDAEIALIVTNKSDAYVLERAKKFNITSKVVKGNKELRSIQFSEFLQEQKIDLIVLAGFLLLIPKLLISHFPDRIINIHPALLPKYGGKGMYGDNVHEAVVQNNEKYSGITIHYVNENYDDGQHILQATCPISTTDTAKDVAKKVQKLEHTYFPYTIKQVIEEL